MASSTPSLDTVRRIFDQLGPPGTPFTTSEIAAEFDCSDRTIYNRLDDLVEADAIETKKVGAKGRVWWKPVGGTQAEFVDSKAGRDLIRYHPVFDSDLVGVVVWDENVTISDANDTFLEMAGLEYAEALGTSWQELTPEAFYSASKNHIQEVEETGSGVPYEKQYYHSDGSRWWGLFESRQLTDGEKVEFVFEITERKRRERRDKFLVELTETLQPLSDPEEIQHEAARVLGEHLDVDRAHYGEVGDDEDTAWIHADYYRGAVPSVVGEHSLSAYGEYIAHTLRAGENLVIDDTQSATELSDEGRRAYASVDNYANVAVPLVKAGRLVAFFSIDNTEPREWTDTEINMVEETAERTWAAVERAQAEKALKTANESLKRLNDVARELIDADSESISDCVAEFTADVLDVPYAALWQYDEQTGNLEIASEYAESGRDADSVRLSEVSHERVWETFIGDEIRVDDGLDVADEDTSPSRVGRRVFVPLGRHGVIVIGSVNSETFDEWRLDLVKMVGATVGSAWDRAESERSLAERNEDLNHLDRVNTLIRRIDQGLVDAETVDEIDEMVCGHLADSALFEFAWLGAYDADVDGVRPRAWAGLKSGPLEDISPASKEPHMKTNPFVAAVQSGRLQVVADIATDARAGPWREAALGLGARSCLVLPLTYNESTYGILVVYGRTPQPNERELDVLEELGRTISHAIHAVETRQISQADSVIELTLQTSVDTPLVRLARELDCVIEFQGLAPGEGVETIGFFTAIDVDPDNVVAAAEGALALEDAMPLVEPNDEVRFKVQITDKPLVELFHEEGASIRSLTIDAGTATAVVTVADTADVRGFIDQIKRNAPDLDLLARRSRRQSFDTTRQLQTAFEERLTPRQREILQLAYRSGYFESPRLQTGQELSQALDLSQSTFNHHLRGAERRIFDAVFADAEVA